MPRDLSVAAMAILGAIADGTAYGFDLMDRTGLPSGTVYPALARFERDGLVRSGWEDARRAQREKRPPRRYYEITAEGARTLKDALDRVRAIAPSRRWRQASPAKG